MDTAMLNLRGYVPPVGPVLGAVPWPQAMVTTARSVDGVSLDVEIRAVEGSADDVLSLSFSQLRPNETYRVDGRTITADLDGAASVEVTVAAAARLRLEPETLP